MSKRPVILDCNSDRFCFKARAGCTHLTSHQIDQSVVTFKRVGGVGGISGHNYDVAQYKVHEQLDDGTCCVLLDAVFHRLPFGRYWCEVYLPNECGDCCDRIQVQIGEKCKIVAAEVIEKKCGAC